MKGLAIDVVQAIIIMVFVLLLVTFLFSGVWKDVISKFGKDIGIQEPTKLEGVSLASDRTDISCMGIVIGSGNGYRYQVGMQGMKIRIETPKDIVPILLFKDKAALSYNSDGSPAYIPKDRIENDEGSNMLYTIETMSPPVINEFLTIAVFEKNDKCIDVARAGSAENTFAACAGFLIGISKLTVSSASSCTGLEPLGSISDITGDILNGWECNTDYRMTNIGGINWMPSHKIKSILRCINDKYIPQAADMYAVGGPLAPQGSVRASMLTPPAGTERICPLWDVAKQQLEGRPEWEQFRYGWRIELYYDCNNNVCDPSKKMAEVSFKEQCSRCLRFDTYESCIVNNNCYQSSQQCEICPANPTCSLFNNDPRQCTNRCGLSCEWTGTACEPTCDRLSQTECRADNGRRCYYDGGGIGGAGAGCRRCPAGSGCGNFNNGDSCRQCQYAVGNCYYTEPPGGIGAECRQCALGTCNYPDETQCRNCLYGKYNCHWDSNSCRDGFACSNLRETDCRNRYNTNRDCWWYNSGVGAGSGCMTCNDILSRGCRAFNYQSECGLGICGSRCYHNFDCVGCGSNMRCEDLREREVDCHSGTCVSNCYWEGSFIQPCKTCSTSTSCNDYNTRNKCEYCDYPKSGCRWDGSSCVNR